MEIWKPVKNYEGIYEISSYGNLRSVDRQCIYKNGSIKLLKGKPKKLQYIQDKYVITTLSKDNTLKTFAVHLLVAEAFLPRVLNKTQINHIDGNKHNNHIENLEWVTPSENKIHAFKTGLQKRTGISKYHNVTYCDNPLRPNRKWRASIRYKRKNYGLRTFLTEEDAARHVDFLLDSIGDTTRPRNFPKTLKCPTTIEKT